MKRGKALVRVGAALGLILAIGLMASPAAAAAEDPPGISNMKVSLWPEYDDPRIMVQYEGEFRDGTAFPRAVQFPVPTGTEMNMVCALQPPNGEHLCQLYTMQAASDQVTVSYTLPIPTYYLEYYWEGIQGQSEKSFAFDYKAPYAIDRLELEVQQPLKATEFKASESYASVTTDGLGMKYYHYIFENVAQGEVITVGAAYTKPDNKPSVAKQQSNSSGTGVTNSGGNSYLVPALGAALLAAVIVGFVLLKRKPAPAPARAVASGIQPQFRLRKEARAEARRIELQRAQAMRVQRTPNGRQTQPPPATVSPQGAAGFCTQCGTKLFGGSLFCHACGAKSKTAT